jgi:hypothetical protein
MPDSDDEHDWANALRGDGEAFGRIFDRHRHRVLRHSFRLVTVMADADDTESPAQKAEMSDGVVTRDEDLAAVSRYVGCMDVLGSTACTASGIPGRGTVPRANSTPAGVLPDLTNCLWIG